ESYFTGLIKDISDKTRLRKKLKESDSKYKFFLKSSNEGIWRIELEEPVDTTLSTEEQVELFYKYAVLRECNDAMAQTYGYHKSSDMIGFRLGQMLPRTDENLAYLTAFIESDYNLIDAESSEMTKENKQIYILNSLTGIVRDGKLRTAWGVQRDITDLVIKQRELELVNDELEHFVYSISHDIQDPVRLIYSYAELLSANKTLSKEERKMICSMYDTAKRIEGFTNSLLIHAQAGKVTTTEVMSSKHAVETAMKNLELLIKESKAKIYYSELLNV